jgi:hypothetical protein
MCLLTNIDDIYILGDINTLFVSLSDKRRRIVKEGPFKLIALSKAYRT